MRAELLAAHLQAFGSQNSLCARVRDILDYAEEVSSAGMTEVVRKVDELLEIDPSDKRHESLEHIMKSVSALERHLCH